MVTESYLPKFRNYCPLRWVLAFWGPSGELNFCHAQAQAGTVGHGGRAKQAKPNTIETASENTKDTSEIPEE